MKFKVLFLVFILCCILGYGQDFKLTLFPDTIPNNRTTGETDRWDTTDLVRVTNVQEPEIAVYLPPKRVATGRTIVVIPGGGYYKISYQWEGIEVAKWLNSNGIAAIVLKYRLPYTSNNIVSYKSPILDAQRAIRLVRYHAGEWNIQENKIGVMGFSAGGHLASTTITHFDFGNSEAEDPIEKISCRPDFAVLIYPVISMYEPDVHKGSRNNLLGENPEEELLEEFSAHKQIKDDTPPVFLVHASDDSSVPVNNSILLYNALVEKGISTEMHIYPFGGHGFSMALDKGYVHSWTERCIDWVEYITNDKK